MARRKVLCVSSDNESQLLSLLDREIGECEFHIVKTYPEALIVLNEIEDFKLILLRSDMDGFLSHIQVIENIRIINEGVPVIVVARQSNLIHERYTYQEGGDDYIVDNQNPRTIIERVRRSVERVRATRTFQPVVTHGIISYDFIRLEITLGGSEVVKLPKKLHIIFALLFTNIGNVVPIRKLQSAMDLDEDSRVHKTQIANLKSLLVKGDGNPDSVIGQQVANRIKNEYGVGYVLLEE